MFFFKNLKWLQTISRSLIKIGALLLVKFLGMDKKNTHIIIKPVHSSIRLEFKINYPLCFDLNVILIHREIKNLMTN